MKPGPRPRPEIAHRNAKIAATYLDGASLSAVATDFGVSVRLVRKILAALNIQTRPGGRNGRQRAIGQIPERRPSGKPATPRLTLEQREAAAERRRSYLSAYHRDRNNDPAKRAMIERANANYKTRRTLARFMRESAKLVEKLDDD